MLIAIRIKMIKEQSLNSGILGNFPRFGWGQVPRDLVAFRGCAFQNQKVGVLS
jgi:hypothetical protein